jgi:hypothetical protein
MASPPRVEDSYAYAALHNSGQEKREENDHKRLLRQRSIHRVFGEGGEAEEEVSKARLARITERELRRISTLKLLGADGMVLWFIRATYGTALTYATVCSAIYCAQRYYGISVHEALLGDTYSVGYRPFLIGALQFLAAYLVGVGLNDAVVRYKNAMTAITDLSDSIENLRMILLSSTKDPKMRIAVQVHIAWLMVLLRKKIAFFSEHFDQPICDLIDPYFQDCVLFRPEVLWALDRSQAEYVFASFLREAKFFDREGMLKRAWDDMSRHWKTIISLLIVRAPTTRNVLARQCVDLFLITIPIFNEDLVTLVMLPVVACVLNGIVSLSCEIAEPWLEDYHDLPMKEVMYFNSVPVWFGKDQSVCAEAIAWLNKGLMEADFECKGDHPIPREKRRGSNKGDHMNFDRFTALHDVAGYESFQEFVDAKREDMDHAEKRGRRMPSYLRWQEPMKPA